MHAVYKSRSHHFLFLNDIDIILNDSNESVVIVSMSRGVRLEKIVHAYFRMSSENYHSCNEI